MTRAARRRGRHRCCRRTAAAHRARHDPRHIPVHGAGAARRQEADARTDIFAFGAVLYEMVTGEGRSRGRARRAWWVRFSNASPCRCRPCSRFAPRARSDREDVPGERIRRTDGSPRATSGASCNGSAMALHRQPQARLCPLWRRRSDVRGCCPLRPSVSSPSAPSVSRIWR